MHGRMHLRKKDRFKIDEVSDQPQHSSLISEDLSNLRNTRTDLTGCGDSVEGIHKQSYPPFVPHARGVDTQGHIPNPSPLQDNARLSRPEY